MASGRVPTTVSAWAWGLSALLIAATGWYAWQDYDIAVAEPREHRVGQYLEANQERLKAAEAQSGFR